MFLFVMHAPALAAPVLFEADFEDRAAWTTDVGATTGGKRASRVDVASGGRGGTRALRFRGDDKTGRWLSATSAPVAVQPGQVLELGGWMRTDDVRREGRQFQNAYLGLVFTDVTGRPVPDGLVAAGWATGDANIEVLRRAMVPDEAVNVQVIAFLSMSGTMWVDDVRLTADPATAWTVVQEGRMRFHALDAAPLTEADRAWNVERLAHTEEVLGARFPGDRIDFWRYPDREVKGAYTGMRSNGHFDGRHSVHTLWPRDAHEVVHLVSTAWGNTDGSFLGEGLAVAISESWQGQPVHDFVRGWPAGLPTPGALIDDFWAHDDLLSYAVAGSFVRDLIDTHGIGGVRQAWTGDAPVRERLAAAFGVPFEELVLGWQERVFDGAPPPPVAVGTSFPELAGLKLVDEVIVEPRPGGCEGQPVHAATVEDSVVHIPGARAVRRVGETEPLALPLDLQSVLLPGRHALCVELEGGQALVDLYVRVAPYTQIALFEWGRDGSGTGRSIVSSVHKGPDALTEDRWVSSDLLRAVAVTDEQGRELPLEVIHDEDASLFRYRVTLSDPVSSSDPPSAPIRT